MIEQIIIALSQLIALYFIHLKSENHQKYAGIFGLFGQPFWFYASYTSQQWGTFILCFFFAVMWYKNLDKYWLN